MRANPQQTAQVSPNEWFGVGVGPARADEPPGRATGLAGLVLDCAVAVYHGQPTVKVTLTQERPVGFPQAELLSVESNGKHAYAADPVKVLAWVHAITSKMARAPRH